MLDSVQPSEAEIQYIRPSFIELGSRYVCQVICLYILYKMNEIKPEDTTETVYTKFHEVVDVEGLCKYFPVFYPAYIIKSTIYIFIYIVFDIQMIYVIVHYPILFLLHYKIRI